MSSHGRFEEGSQQVPADIAVPEVVHADLNVDHVLLRPGGSVHVFLDAATEEDRLPQFDPPEVRSVVIGRVREQHFIPKRMMSVGRTNSAVSRPARSDPPGLALRLLGREEAAHYAREWGAHLWELSADGEHRQARRDRRRMALGAPWLALQLRTRALLRRRLRSSR